MSHTVTQIQKITCSKTTLRAIRGIFVEVDESGTGYRQAADDCCGSEFHIHLGMVAYSLPELVKELHVRQ